MPVVAMSIESINAKKQSEVAGGVKVNSNTNIKEVKEQKLPGLSKNALLVDFEFITNYTDDKDKKIAEFIIGGNVLVVDDKYKEALELWKKTKKLPEDMSIEVINVIFNKCSKKAILLSDDLQLPSPVPLPFAKKKQN
jgi:hypothetical protein